MVSITNIVAGIGIVAIALLLIVLGLISRRLGRVTHAKGYYRLFFVSALLMLMGAGGRMWSAFRPDDLIYDNIWWILIYNGAPTLGLTLAVVVAWYYWSWLLAERD